MAQHSVCNLCTQHSYHSVSCCYRHNAASPSFGGTAPLTGPLCAPQMTYEWMCSRGVMILTGENRRIWKQDCLSAYFSTANITRASGYRPPGKRLNHGKARRRHCYFRQDVLCVFKLRLKLVNRVRVTRVQYVWILLILSRFSREQHRCLSLLLSVMHMSSPQFWSSFPSPQNAPLSGYALQYFQSTISALYEPPAQRARNAHPHLSFPKQVNQFWRNLALVVYIKSCQANLPFVDPVEPRPTYLAF
jgi:hypothetical protein